MKKRGQANVDGPVSRSVRNEAGPLFSSSLDEHQATPDQLALFVTGKPHRWSDDHEIDHTPTAYDYYIEPLTPFEEHFRHSGWRESRKRVNAALRSCQCPPARLEKFEKCGSACVVEQHSETGEIRLRANYCGDRFCVPCARSRGIKFERDLLNLIGRDRVKFATFTRRDDGKTLIESLDHLRKSWTRLREQKIWSDHVKAAVYVVEITRGKKGTGWHVHLHAIMKSDFVDQRDWSKAWAVATGGSPIVHIRDVTDTKRDVGYVCKYATKALDASVMRDHDALCEAIIGLRGRRLIGSLGEWFNFTEPWITGPTEGWKRIGSLQSIGTAAIAGSKADIGLLSWARRTPVDELADWLRGCPSG